MYEQIREDIIFIMLYTLVTGMAMIACCYLLLRRGNAFAPEVTPPVHLRRWTAALFAATTLNHLWYMPIFFLNSSEDLIMNDLAGGLLDSMTVFPLTIVVMFAMLQDRRRPLWPVAVIFAPLVAGNAWSVVTRSYVLLPMLYAYSLLMCIVLIIYMVRATKQYGRWLRDNYADLEHKEVWQSFLVLSIILLVFVVYAFVYEGTAYLYAMQVITAVLIGYLLWRVETLNSLTPDPSPTGEGSADPAPDELYTPLSSRRGVGGEAVGAIGPLLKQYCEESCLYLQHDLNIHQLARTVGTNRFYLSQYFSNQGMTYNTYINGLRIQHFMSLYQKAVAAQRPFTARQLAFDSGYRSYSTFSAVFKQLKGQTVTAWMRDTTR